MLRVNIGLSRKITRDYQSTGYSVNLDGEIPAPATDPNAIQQAIDRLFNLAEDALRHEIERDQGGAAPGRRDEPPANQPQNGRPQASDRPPANNNSNGHAGNGHPGNGHAGNNQGSNGHAGNNRTSNNRNQEPASNKQTQYIWSLAKQQNLSKDELERLIEELFRQRLTVYQITKWQAGRLIDRLNQQAPANGR